MVFPRPMSSARHPPNENWRRNSNQPRPSFLIGAEFVRRRSRGVRWRRFRRSRGVVCEDVGRWHRRRPAVVIPAAHPACRPGPGEADGVIALVILHGRAGLDDDAVLGEPFFRQDAEGSVGKFDKVFAFSRRGEKARKGNDLIAKLHRAREVKPIDARGDGNSEIGGGAIKFSFGLNDPTFADQRRNHRRATAAGRVRDECPRYPCRQFCESQRTSESPAPALRRPYRAGPFFDRGIISTGGGSEGFHRAGVVIKEDVANDSLIDFRGIAGAGRLSQDKARPRRANDLLEVEFFRKVETRNNRQRSDLPKKIVSIIFGTWSGPREAKSSIH